MIISIVNRTKSIGDSELQGVIRAINQQIERDFEPYWSFGATLRLEGQIGKQPNKTTLPELRGDAVIYVWDDVDLDEALGYHETNARGIPYAFVFSDLAKQLNERWTVTLSHEVLELVGDAQCNLLVQGPHPEHPALEVFHWFEMCDAVQSQTYKIDDVVVANFLLPLYFTAEEQEGGRNDFLGHRDKDGKSLQSFGVAEGGYIGFYNPRTRAHETYSAPTDAAARKRLEIKAKYRSGRGFLRKRSVQVEPREFTHKNLLAGVGLSQRLSSAAEDHIKHVVVLMLENRSFDQMLGAMAKVNRAIDGVKLNGTPHSNSGLDGTKYPQMPGAPYVSSGAHDPPHEHANVLTQIGSTSAPMTGFVVDFLKKYPNASAAQTAEVMSYFDVAADDPALDTLPALHTLARHFAVCDAWYSSVPGPTWQNRFFVHSGTSLGHTEMPSASEFWKIRVYYQPTVYDAMTDANIRWKIYYDGIPQSIVMTRLLTRYLTKRCYGTMDDFYADAQGAADSFPEYSFIEPRYVGKDENDQHPPTNVMRGEALIANVYNAIRENSKLWESTLLIVTYDEHGGYYDHVYPPKSVAPDAYTEEWSFDQLGVRVPTILVSPWIDQGVVKTPLEHTSILRYVCEKWALPPFGNRMQASAGALRTKSFAAELTKRSVLRNDTPPKLTVPVVKIAKTATEPPIEGSRAALLAYVQSLPTPAGAKATLARRRATTAAMTPGELFSVDEALAKLAALSAAETGARSGAATQVMEATPTSAATGMGKELLTLTATVIAKKAAKKIGVKVLSKKVRKRVVAAKR